MKILEPKYLVGSSVFKVNLWIGMIFGMENSFVQIFVDSNCK